MLAERRPLAAIRLISINPRLLAAQQMAQHIRIVHIGSAGRHGVDQLGVAVYADM